MQSSQSPPKSGRSVQSSLLSEDLLLPDEAVYSKYDDAIAMVDVDVDTAVSRAPADADKTTDSPGVRRHVTGALLLDPLCEPMSQPLLLLMRF